VTVTERVTANLRLVHAVARRYAKRRYNDYDDLVAAGNIGLVIAAQRYKPELGNAFSTFAYPWIRWHMITALLDRNNPCGLGALKTANTHRRKQGRPYINTKALYLDAEPERGNDAARIELDDDRESPADRIEREQDQRRVECAIGWLPSREREIIRQRFCDEPKTLADIGRRLRLSRERVRQLEASALAKVRRVIGGRR
jgi:RNA polymerase sigma factor (sigma-70 family)